ncbi:uncharacterized protein VICG_00656 [Vittaforma corneae ATCC 50505]|uniref:Uncharacterized protein n=1 Tax=Vittaforma corneae (strain ATCC 50505) TaxID=993615 RepID=L2GPM2_VITCO|nr:uncharacterized protein VICG_00656 [Vittaforma corneae ATCC 50505]ELA42257.1 hypothetical protein VICG_00656 [Vittaforma corneae ATCC 50505]
MGNTEASDTLYNACKTRVDAFSQNSDVLEYLKANRKTKFNEDDVFSVLEGMSAQYCLAFYFLSESNRVINAKTYKLSFLFKNLESFPEEDLYYLSEGIKNQIFLCFDDFFIVIHMFFSVNLLKHTPIQNLLIFLLQNFDYKMREFLISTSILKELFFIEGGSTTFHFKLLKILLDSDNPMFTLFLGSLNLKINISEPIGCQKYFKPWYNSLREEKRLIKICFIQ